MHTLNDNANVQQYLYNGYKSSQHGNRTPIQENLGQFLKFQHPIPRTPEMLNYHRNSNNGLEDTYTDKNYNLLINSAEIINQNFDAGNLSQDIDLDLFDTLQPIVEDTIMKPTNKSSSSSLKRISSSGSSSRASRGSKRVKRVSSKGIGLGAASKRLHYEDCVSDNNNNSSSSDSSSSSEDEDDNNVVVKKNNKKSEVEEDDAIANNVATSTSDCQRVIVKPKVRGRYAKKMCISSAMKPVHVEKPTPSDPATEILFNEIIKKYSKKNAANANNSVVSNNRMFASHILDTSYYMFIVSKSANPDEIYSIRYINCVHSVYNEYTAHHLHNDRFVLVVTLERYRFMISYHLLQDMKISIPIQDQFSEKKLSDTNKNLCYFEEVKDFGFLSLLINTFHLDQVYVQGKTSLLFASIGEEKSKNILQYVNQMTDNKHLFTMPFSITRKEAPNQEDLKKYDMSVYVDDIMKFSTGLQFKTMDNLPNQHKMSRNDLLSTVARNLKFWYLGKQQGKNNNAYKDKTTNNFTYKYGCIARQFYDSNHKGVKKLFKIKKENGSAKLIENYLHSCKERFENHSFILITTKADERITIVKFGLEFLWITSVIKDIVVPDIVKEYGMYNHYIYNLNTGNRKEINIRHNGMIKLLSHYTGGLITFKEMNSIACDNFGCNFEKIIFDKKTAAKQDNDNC
ncbi:immediate-early transcriptional regulatory protein 1 [Spodoptera frugiperda multiple nucleopolyhedrovirus]|uniref:IE-1 n=1 Tax=Spodoptera frugiperda nuclear polyhedrosis virus TaxID=10455 RepID=A1YJC6_NPVSF|nr:immediate-early transcriptional regulatory protein 1 [Spodoptera frugiperda multiple nucleopolyhedrovirus]ABM45846.1 immediate-early transcriptional regulatory protein 1 [Spodoptera frugiperda multiple nucleopolyhedrovirus]QED40049.1 IE-1 [Spodoptera frugiperda multiple nucleopolyhedrovirus]